MKNSAIYPNSFIEEKFKSTNKITIEIQEKLAALASNKKNPDRAVELLNDYQSQLETLNEDLGKCLEYEESLDRL